MKKSLILILLIAGIMASCKNDSHSVQENRGGGPNSELIRNPATANMPTDTNMLARIVFEQPEFDFGTVNEGDIVNHTFKFTNVGKVPLTILKCQASCGCTIPEWPEEPIPPGGTGEIKAKFNTEGKLKEQKKSITVTANTYPNASKVVLKGMVNPVKG